MNGKARQKSADMKKATSMLLSVLAFMPKKPSDSYKYPRHPSTIVLEVSGYQQVLINFPSSLYTVKSDVGLEKVMKNPMICTVIATMYSS